MILSPEFGGQLDTAHLAVGVMADWQELRARVGWTALPHYDMTHLHVRVAMRAARTMVGRCACPNSFIKHRFRRVEEDWCSDQLGTTAQPLRSGARLPMQTLGHGVLDCVEGQIPADGDEEDGRSHIMVKSTDARAYVIYHTERCRRCQSLAASGEDLRRRVFWQHLRLQRQRSVVPMSARPSKIWIVHIPITGINAVAGAHRSGALRHIGQGPFLKGVLKA